MSACAVTMCGLRGAGWDFKYYWRTLSYWTRGFPVLALVFLGLLLWMLWRGLKGVPRETAIFLVLAVVCPALLGLVVSIWSPGFLRLRNFYACLPPAYILLVLGICAGRKRWSRIALTVVFVVIHLAGFCAWRTMSRRIPTREIAEKLDHCAGPNDVTVIVGKPYVSTILYQKDSSRTFWLYQVTDANWGDAEYWARFTPAGKFIRSPALLEYYIDRRSERVWLVCESQVVKDIERMVPWSRVRATMRER